MRTVMNFQDILSFWREKDLLRKTLDMFIDMLEGCHWMYQASTKYLWDEGVHKDLRDEIYDRDIKINKLERSIRKMAVEHLSVNPQSETNFCLILMSVCKDTERVGDYCKNIVELRDYHAPYGDAASMAGDFQAIQGSIEGMFTRVGKAFRDSDEEAAKELIEESNRLQKGCDELLARLMDVKGFSTGQAVCYALLARHNKRIAAHLGNVATAVVMPVHKLDYQDEKYL